MKQIENRVWLHSVTALYIANHFDISVGLAILILDDLCEKVDEIKYVGMEYFWQDGGTSQKDTE